MDIVVERGAGLDVHKHSVVACIMGTGIKKEIRTYGTIPANRQKSALRFVPFG
jgi:hypothetical protein